MKPIVVRDQTRLGPLRCLALSITGMSHRFFRSMITVAILTLAVAFLAHMLSYGIIDQRTRVEAYRELKDSHLLGEWLARLSGADAEVIVEEHLVGASAVRLSEYKAWSGVGDDEFGRTRVVARRLAEVYAYFESLPLTARTILTSGLEPRQTLARLREPERLAAFMKRLDELKFDPPLGNRETFQKLVTKDVLELWTIIAGIGDGHRRAVQAVRGAFPDKSLLELLASPPEGFPDVLSRAGFSLSGETSERLSVLAEQRKMFTRVAETIDLPHAKNEIARELGIDRTLIGVETVLLPANSRTEATWLSELLLRHAGEPGVSAEQILSLSRTQRRLNRLQAAVGDKPPVAGGGFLMVPTWMQWLIGLSFLVCVVGVTNAMFMSVTERFTEIATMKCLGALDGFLMLLFLFESSLQGLVGAVAGVVLGIALAALRGLMAYGGLICLPAKELLTGAALCLLVGLVLAVVGGVGPAWAAARLAPMEAMRIE